MANEIVITGASGFVGQALMKTFKKNGFLVTGLSRKVMSGLTTVNNYYDIPFYDNAILIHLAQSRNISDLFNDEDINLCQTLFERSWRHIIYASSAVVYGDLKDSVRSPEESITGLNEYSKVKLACEKIVSNFGGTSLRLTNLYGPGMGIDTVISDILRQIPSKEPLKLIDILPIRDFLWIEDAARCFVSACQIMPGEILNVGSGISKSIAEIAYLATLLAGEDSRSIIGKNSSSQLSCIRLDITKTRLLLNWSPEVDISAGLLYLLTKKMKNKKNRIIAVFTGNRAEYGLQYPILRAINRHPNLDYRLLVSGAHLDSNFGNTLNEIRHDGFHIDAEVKIEMDANSLFSTAKAIGSGILAISNVLNKLQPDIMLVYADRFEGFAAVIAASQMNIPTAHVEGGDLTEGGALDDSVRHAMTKLAHLHFTTNQQASNRIIAMGEEPWRVHTVGFPAIDLILEGKFASATEVAEKLNLDLSRPIVLFTQHSVSTEFNHAAKQITPSLVAIRQLATEGIQTILTYPNNDAGGQSIIKELENFGAANILNTQVFQSLGRYLYHGVLALARDPSLRVACVGNSSSGLKETPAFGCPTVNIGSRQEGRLRGENVLDADYDMNNIYAATLRCLFDKDFRELSQRAENPYWIGDAGPKIADILATVSLDQQILRKRMTLQGDVQDGWYR